MEFSLQYGILAQLVEHLTFNQVVGGSNPPCLKKQKRYCNAVPFLFLLKGDSKRRLPSVTSCIAKSDEGKICPVDKFSDVARESPVLSNY